MHATIGLIRVCTSYVDLVKDLFLLATLIVVVGGLQFLKRKQNFSSQVCEIKKYKTLIISYPYFYFSCQVVLLFVASIFVPMYLGGLRLTIYNPELIFGPRVHRSRFHRIMFSIFAFMLSPFHTFFLHLQQFYIEVKSRAEDADRALAFQRDIITYQLRKAVKFEFGLEGIFQMAGQFILFLNAISLTRTHEAFKAIFDEETPGERCLLIFSVIWSFKTCILSHLKVVSASREHFPIMSKIVIGLYSFFSVSSRVLCMIMFFAPSLGLFDLLKHLQAEQTPWHPDLSNFVMNDVNGMILHFGSNYSLDWNRVNR